MKKAPKIKNDEERLKKLYSYNILDTAASAEFDHITRLASNICETNICVISLVDKDRQWFKSRVGLDATETPRDISFCGHAIEHENILMVENATLDERFSDNPLVVDGPKIRFYAGAPLVTKDGYKLGTLCVIDNVAKSLNKKQMESLEDLSKLVVEILDIKIKNTELDHLKNQYEDVQEMSRTGGWELDLKTNKTIWSKEIYKIHGIPFGQSPDKLNAISFYAEHERDKLIGLLEKCAKEKVPYDDVFEFYDAQGNKKWVQAMGKPVVENDGTVKKLIGTFRDITEKRQMEQIVSHNAKLAAIGQLAAGVGHEINNPLAIIKGYVGTILRGHPDLENKVSENLKKIDGASDRIAKIVSGLRTFARFEKAGKSELFNVKELIHYMENMIREIYFHEGVDLSFNYQDIPELLCIEGERGKLEQVLMNLISNAKDATSGQESRKIDVDVNYIGHNLVIKVKDNGTGISSADKDRIFEPFFSTKEVGKGTGIGLSLVHKFIHDDFGGSVELESNINKGALFTLKLPAQNYADKKVEEPSYEGVHFGLKAIIAEDESAICAFLQELLADFGIEAVAFENGKLALEEYSKNPDQYDLIISDMQMPVMDGPEFLKALREDKILKQPKFIFTTGGINVDFDDPENEFKQLIDGYLLKPFKLEEVVKELLNIFPEEKKRSA